MLNFPVIAAAKVANCDPRTGDNSFFGLPHWWEYISTGERDAFGKCVPKVTFPDGMWAIGFAVIDILLFAAGIIAVVSIIIAGVKYITSMGNPENASAARKRITNSLIGLGIIIIASAVVSFIGKSLGGT